MQEVQPPGGGKRGGGGVDRLHGVDRAGHRVEVLRIVVDDEVDHLPSIRGRGVSASEPEAVAEVKEAADGGPGAQGAGYLLESSFDGDVPGHGVRGHHRDVQRDAVDQRLQPQRDVAQPAPARADRGAAVRRGPSLPLQRARFWVRPHAATHCAVASPLVSSLSKAHSTGPPVELAILENLL